MNNTKHKLTAAVITCGLAISPMAAMAHTGEGGTITVGAKGNAKMVRLWVEDDGVGIDEAQRAKVFEEFESGQRGGAGLGLALARSLIDLHGGLVSLESEKGKGTKVTCLLPRQASTQNAPPELDLKSAETRAKA